MRITHTLSLRAVDASADCEILHNGQPTGTLVRSAVVVGELTSGATTLLFAIHDTPYEETLNVYGLDTSFRVIDRATLGIPYQTGEFSQLTPVGRNTATFRFLGASPWKIEAFDSPRILIPFVSEPLQVWRKPGLRRWFRITRQPAP